MKVFNVKNLSEIVIIFLLSLPAYAQELGVGADIVSRYIWRGLEVGGNSPSIQPSFNLSAGGFTAGFWGALPTANPGAAVEEIDFYASYLFDLNNSGGISLGFTDYMFPNSGTKIGNFNNYDDEEGPGAHQLEANAGYYGPETFPIYFTFNIFFYNAANNPIYFEAGYNTSINDVGFGFFIGGTPGEENGYYGVTEFSIINIGIKASKDITFSESFSLPVFGSVILNPSQENLFFVVGVSL